MTDKCQSSSFITYLGQWFRDRQTREHIPVPPPNDPRHLPPPSQFVHLASATVHPNPPRCKRAIPFRPRHFSPEPTNCRPRSGPFPTRQNNSVAPPPPTRPVSTEHLCPGPLHCRRVAPADSSLPFSTPTCYQRAALLRSPPIPPKPRTTTCTLLTTRNPTEPLCSGPVFPAEGHRLVMIPTDSRIAAIPSIWLGWLPRPSSPGLQDTPPLSLPRPWRSQCLGDTVRSPPHLVFRRRLLRNSYRPPDTHDHLVTVTALLFTVWLILLSTNVGAPTAPFHGYPGPNHAAFRRPTVPPGQLFSLSTSVPGHRQLFHLPQLQQTHGLSLPSQLFTYPPSKPPAALQPFLDNTTTDDLRNHG